MDRKLLKTVQTITTFRNPLADPVGTRRGPPLVRGPQFENRWYRPIVMILYRGIDGLCSNLSMRVCKIPQTNELRHFLVRLEIFMLGSVPTFKF